MIYPDLSLELPVQVGIVHFIGVGGSGMSGIAHLFVNAGYVVTGSDATENANTIALRERGVRVDIGHDARNLGNADTVVVTGALWPDNPEYVRAQKKGLPVLHRSQALSWLIGDQRLVAVAGAHGKTTSTGMIATGLLGLDQDPSFVNGGVIEALGVSSADGQDPLFVVEADESDGSFLIYNTAIALITNVDPEHLDYYGSREKFMEAFVTFVRNASELVVISADDAGAQEVLGQLDDQQKVLTFGESESADVRVHSIVTQGPVSFSIRYRGEDFSAQLSVPGHHNAINAAGAAAVLIGLGNDPQASLAAVAEFGGTKRRFELHAEIGGVRVYDDYAHHPTEVEALLTSARTVVGGGRVIAVHQPHLYSRTRLFSREFAEVLESHADHTVVLAVCGAREDPEPGVTGELVSEKFKDPTKVAYIDEWQAAADYVAQISQPGDYVITMGCGDVYRIIPQLRESLEGRRP
ncbi:UDP-N-acetylmuramate--L-alanine ligase [Lysinibacter sp. HNR]|uniref:UDP-N-acetylmuramate--L-alanine ligase n=1 Tax=Lysinibacter sp. HNR TaxID=3031408 RepID=UPI002434CEC0|nr:UDP-N-acetylmuramate--L-alanine ligase [Lysinibacter sp. HNR]WGD36468.1 UDP-N-acetylmuramate--L-alanine ligase [Lysinibacter sp. HNR]